MSNADLNFTYGASRNGDPFVEGTPTGWARSRRGGSVRQARDFFQVHWQINTPYHDAVRLHVESPTHDIDPGLNDLKRDVIKALWNGRIERVVERKGFIYQRGSKTSRDQVRTNKSTEAFRVVLTETQCQPTDEANIALVHAAVGAAVNAIVQQFATRLDQEFSRGPAGVSDNLRGCLPRLRR